MDHSSATGAALAHLLRPAAGARVIDTGAARWWLDPSGVVCNHSYADHVSAQHIRDGLRAAVELSGGRRIPLVAEAGPFGGSDREARDLLAGPEAAAVYTAMAVVVRSPVARTLMNFFVRFARPPFPVQVFTSPSEAIAWAAGFRESSGG
jgi:hypothetical protein